MQFRIQATTRSYQERVRRDQTSGIERSREPRRDIVFQPFFLSPSSSRPIFRYLRPPLFFHDSSFFFSLFLISFPRDNDNLWVHGGCFAAARVCVFFSSKKIRLASVTGIFCSEANEECNARWPQFPRRLGMSTNEKRIPTSNDEIPSHRCGRGADLIPRTYGPLQDCRG